MRGDLSPLAGRGDVRVHSSHLTIRDSPIAHLGSATDASPRNDEVFADERPHSRGVIRPSFASAAPNNRGRRESRASDAPAASRAKVKKHTSKSTTGSPERAGLPCADGFNGFLRGLPGDRAFLPPSPAGLSHRLDISVEISGPHDFAVRDKRIRLVRQARPPHPAPNTRDDREAPLIRARDGTDDAGDLGVRSMRTHCGTLARRANHVPRAWRMSRGIVIPDAAQPRSGIHCTALT